MKIIKGWAIVNAKGDEFFFDAKKEGRTVKGFSVLKTQAGAKYWLSTLSQADLYRIQKVKVEEEK